MNIRKHDKCPKCTKPYASVVNFYLKDGELVLHLKCLECEERWIVRREVCQDILYGSAPS